MATPRKKITPKKTHQQTGNSKIIESVILVTVIYMCFAVYEAVINPFLWAFDVRNSAGTCLLIGFSFLLFFKWK